MIVFRYLSREIFTTLFGISLTLLLIIMSNRFVKYLAEAATGGISADVLFLIMGLRLPGFLELILPLGLFLGILLGYGRLYMESEMVVLSACGFSQRRLLAYTLVPGIIVAGLVGWLSLSISPSGMQKVASILNAQKQRSDWETLVPGRFQRFSGGRSVTYAESLSKDKKVIRNVFLAETRGADSAEDGVASLIIAAEGRQVYDDKTGRRYMVLSDGVRYEGIPGQADYTKIRFESFGQLLAEPSADYRREIDAIPTRDLWGSEENSHRAVLHWRLSLPLLVIVVTVLAVPLSYTNPRQGRYTKMIPAILLYLIYLVSLNGVRGSVEEGKASPLALWAVHCGFFAFACSLLVWPWLKRRLSREKS